MDIWAVSHNHTHMRPALGFTQRSSSDGKGTIFGQGSCRVVLIRKVPKAYNIIKLISKLPLVQVLFNSIYGNNCLVIKFLTFEAEPTFVKLNLFENVFSP